MKKLIILSVAIFCFSGVYSQSVSWQHGYTVGHEARMTLLSSAPPFQNVTNLQNPLFYFDNALSALQWRIQHPTDLNGPQNVLGFDTDFGMASGYELNLMQDWYIETVLRNIYIQMMNEMMQLYMDDPTFSGAEFASGYDFGLFS
jgi:hypothetical protein